VLYGSEGYYVGFRKVWTSDEGFRPVGDYIDVRQCKCPGYFAEKDGFLLIGFDQGEMDVGGPDFDGEGGESGATAYVEDVRRAVLSAQCPISSKSGNSRSFASLRMTSEGGRKEMARHKQGLAEMAGYDFFFLADCGQVDAGVPAQ
jgi:hypothetical protein